MMLALLETITDLFVCDQTGGDVLILEEAAYCDEGKLIALFCCFITIN